MIEIQLLYSSLPGALWAPVSTNHNMCNHKLVSKEDYIQIVSAVKSGDVCTSVIQVDIVHSYTIMVRARRDPCKQYEGT